MSTLSRLPGLVSEYFIIESVLGSSRTSDVYKALDKFKRQSVALWRTRVPFSSRTKQEAHFVNRIAHVARLNVGTELVSFGIDAGGYGFAVFPAVNGTTIGSGKAEVSELERRFISVLRIVDKFHAAGIACEDFTIDSFIVDRTGGVKLYDVMAGFDLDSDGTSELPPVDSLRYLPPEHRVSGGGSICGDVFSLGVLGFKLFTGVFPDLGEDETYDNTRRPSDFNPTVPGWVDAVLLKSICSNVYERYGSASNVLDAVSNWREADAQKDLVPAVVDTQSANKSARAAHSVVPIALGHKMGEQRVIEDTEAPVVERKRLSPLGIISILGLCGIFGWAAFTRVLGRPPVSQPVDIEVAPGDLMRSGEGDSSSKAVLVTKLISSDDPVAHDKLIRELKEAQSSEFIEFVWKAILDRARRLGTIRASDQLRAWGKSQGANFVPTSMEPLLRALDTAYPHEERLATLYKLYPTYPKLILRFTAALALDLGKPDDFQSLMAMMAQEIDKVKDATHHSTLSIMLLLPEVSTIFLDDIVSISKQIPDADLSWLMAELAKRGSPHLMKVADLSLSRKIVEPPYTAFLEVLRRTVVIPQPVMVALVAGAFGNLGDAEGVTLSQWFDQDSFPALAATIFTTKSPAIKQAAFEAMMTKPTPNRLIGALLDFAKTNYKDKASSLSDVVAALALEERLGNVDLNLKLKGLEHLPRFMDLMTLLLASESPKVLSAVVLNYENMLTSTTYLDLLKHKEKAVRILAVEHLKTANDIGALKILIDSYEDETDGDVKEAYEKYISVVKERKQK